MAGTHSTGKTTFMRRLQRVLKRRGFDVCYVHDSAAQARKLGFPILEHHTFESTAWLIAHAMRLETAATLKHEVILVDRPVPDALGYLMAALAHTGRTIASERLQRLRTICAAWAGEYDLIFATQLDPAIQLGAGRDGNLAFRVEAGQAVAAILAEMAPSHMLIDPLHPDQALAKALDYAEARRTSLTAASGTKSRT